MLYQESLKTKGRRETKSSALICVFFVVELRVFDHPPYKSSSKAYEDRGGNVVDFQYSARARLSASALENEKQAVGCFVFAQEAKSVKAGNDSRRSQVIGT